MRERVIHPTYLHEARAAHDLVEKIQYSDLRRVVNSRRMWVPSPYCYENEPVYCASLKDLVSAEQGDIQLKYLSVLLTMGFPLQGITTTTESGISARIFLPCEMVISKNERENHWNNPWINPDLQLLVASLVYHELVHVRQLLSGSHPVNSLHKTGTEYLELPCEKEAYREQAAFLAQWGGLMYAYRTMSRPSPEEQVIIDDIFREWDYGCSQWLEDVVKSFMQAQFPPVTRRKVLAQFTQTPGVRIQTQQDRYTILIDKKLFFACHHPDSNELSELLRYAWIPPRHVENAIFNALQEIARQESRGFIQRLLRRECITTLL